MLTPHRLPLGAGPPFCVVVVLVTGSGSRSCVGAGEGMRVGAAVGTAVGLAVGAADGTAEGSAVGTAVCPAPLVPLSASL